MTYAERVTALEAEGLTRSDALAALSYLLERHPHMRVSRAAAIYTIKRN